MVHTTLHPDIILWSIEDKKIIVVELTMPWEDSCEVAHERKSLKYQPLVQECKDKVWQAWLFPVEVGYRGFPAKSVGRLFSALSDLATTTDPPLYRVEMSNEGWCSHLKTSASWKIGKKPKQRMAGVVVPCTGSL